MRLLELINELKLTVPRSKGSTSGVLRTQQLDIIAAGAQAIAYSHKTKPNTVIKVASISGESDPLYQFLRVCVNHGDNPYFPKIYNYKIFNLAGVSNDELEFLYSQEKDIDVPLRANSRQLQLLIVTEKLVDVNAASMENTIKQLGIYDLIMQSSKSFKMALSLAFDSKEMRNKIRTTTNDKYFEQAIRILEPLMSRYIPDLHIDNFMQRPNGHLVINDPLTELPDSGDSEVELW